MKKKELKEEKQRLIESLFNRINADEVGQKFIIDSLEKLKDIDNQIDKKKKKKWEYYIEFADGTREKIGQPKIFTDLFPHSTPLEYSELPRRSSGKNKISSKDIISDKTAQNMINMFCEELASRNPFTFSEIRLQYDRLSEYLTDGKIKTILDQCAAISYRYNKKIDWIVGDMIETIENLK